ncbi:bifunctional nitrate reductase/sulfite reductase flavoprotein subunit alpha [Kineosporia sp. J2-2]|uniref:Bifunctional nitrate reductase/sulfite reductase flavoprotein subunit alpha n=2 Tax=Kineosporia corallincola TaxID=2835133 RepID=A0ABS5TBF6_9ACTN|nr:bifunctional nitrate reductase/sulfite reductase flavoprotein subunit alpha [Kineosporia corallincola]
MTSVAPVASVQDAPAEEVRTVCSYCGVGCGIVLDVVRDASGRRRALKASGDRQHPGNRGRLCTKGATSAQLLAAPGRLEHALVRADRAQEPAATGVDEAIAVAAGRLRAIWDEHGPDSVALYVSGQMSLEAQYLANKLAKGYLRTNQIESNSRLCMASAGTGYKLSLGADGPPGSYDDLDHADVFLVIGSNMADCHPILFLRMMDRVRAGARLIVVDPRRTATAEKADLFLQLRPGTDLALLNGLLHLLAAGGHLDHDFITEHTRGWDTMPALLADYPPDVVEALTGVPETALRQAATMIGTAANWVSCWTMGLNQSTHGTWNTNALVNLHLATGAICRTGSGPFSLTGQPNAMGGREMGYMGPGLPGQRAVTADADRAFVEDLWQLPAGTLRPDGFGTGTVDLFRRMADGEVRACWIICTNPVASVANRRTVIEGLERAELVITQDVFTDTETNAYADVVLPAAMWSESDAVMVSSERTLTLAPHAVDAPGQALPDWLLIVKMARAMGFHDGFRYAGAQEVFDEITRAGNPQTGYDLRGASYPRLRESPLQWPVPAGGSSRNPVRYLNDGVSQRLLEREDGVRPRLAFPTTDGRAVFHPRPHTDPAEMPDEDYPFVMNTGRLQHQWHTLTKTGKVASLNRLNPGPFVEIHPVDAVRLGIAEGDRVEVASRRGRAVLPATITDRVQPGGCFAPFHWNDLYGEYLSVNAVTSDAVDPLSFQPEFKVCAVSLTRVAAAPTAAPVVPDAPQELSAPGRSVVVLYASQTGNAEEFASRTARRLSGAGRPARLIMMDDVRPAALPAGCDLLVITSTFGDGEAPDNGSAFWRSLAGDGTGALTGTRYAVLAFGDSSYDDFCGHGRRLDARLAELGATALHRRTDTEPHDDDVRDRWLEHVVGRLAGEGAAPGEQATPDGRATPDYQATPDGRAAPGDEAAPGDKAASGDEAASGDRDGPGHPVATRKNPGTARLVGNRLLGLEGSAKEVREFVFDTGDSDLPLTYRAGDALGILPRNSEQLVEEFLLGTGLDPQAGAEIDGVGEVSVREALSAHLDISRLTPGLLTRLLDRTPDHTPGPAPATAATRHLRGLLRPGNTVELGKWLWGRQLPDALRELGVRLTPGDLPGLLKPLTPRQYSISSSPLTDPHRIRLTVSVVRYPGPAGHARTGVCSAYLADAPHGQPIEAYVQPTRHFRPPAGARTPAIMIGPGTGVAPFLGFLEERRALGHPGRNWLFFGEQHRASDFYYHAELDQLFREGTLTRLDLAFSRDQRAKVYVQDRMLEHGRQVWRWLEDGAHVYVCGDARRMARDVDAALRRIITRHGGTDPDDYLKRMTAQGRYARDVY